MKPSPYCAAHGVAPCVVVARHLHGIEHFAPFPARTASAAKRAGGSMAISDSNWNRWFGTMSRNAPVAS